MRTIKYLMPLMAVLILGCGEGNSIPVKTNDTKSKPVSGEILNSKEIESIEKNIGKQESDTKDSDVGHQLSDQELNTVEEAVQKAIKEQGNSSDDDIGVPLSSQEENEIKKSL